MLLSPKGRVFLMNHEGVRTRAYKDPIGIVTIGAGMTWRSAAFRKWWSQNRPGQEFNLKSTMTPYEIQEALGFMVQEEYGAAVVKWLGGKQVPEHVMDALISVVWNCGAKALSWKWAQAVKRGDYPTAAKLLKTTAVTAKGKRLRGLVRRREEEAMLLQMGVYIGVPASREWQERNGKPQPLVSIPNAPVPSQAVSGHVSSDGGKVHDMNWDTVQQFVRIVLGWLGAYLVTKGYGDAANVETLTGGLLMVSQFAWWFFWNRRRSDA